MNDDQDQALVRQTLRGEKKAFEVIVRKYQQPLFNYIGRMVGEKETALDLTQEVFVRAFSSLRSYEPRFKFSTWLYRIASHLVIDHWRKKKLPTYSLSGSLDEEADDRMLNLPDHGPSVARRFEMAELRAKIEEALERLPPLFRELFIWRHMNGLSYDEIAEIKKMPIGTVKNRVFEAKERLRRLLEEKT